MSAGHSQRRHRFRCSEKKSSPHLQKQKGEAKQGKAHHTQDEMNHRRSGICRSLQCQVVLLLPWQGDPGRLPAHCGDQVAYFGVNFLGIRQGGGNLRAEKLAVALAETVDRDLYGPFAQS